MPIYEYACKGCGHTLDALQKLSDAPLLDCPECGEAQLKRLLSAPRFRLKGKGWYETDFKKDNQRNLSTGDTDSSKSDKSDSKSDSKKESSKPKSDLGSGKTKSKDTTTKSSSD